MQSFKQGSIKYHFLSLWYDSTQDWTQVSRAIGEHPNHYANVWYVIIIIIIIIYNGWYAIKTLIYFISEILFP